MKESEVTNCKKCAKEIFLHKDGEQYNKFEDLAGIIQHTKLRCEVYQIISERLLDLQIEINRIKEVLER